MKILSLDPQIITIVTLFCLMSFQTAKACDVINVNPRTINVGPEEGSRSIIVETSGCTNYSVSQVGTFFTVIHSGNTVHIDYEKNTSTFTRGGRVIIGHIQVPIYQGAACPVQNAPGTIAGNSSVCIYTSVMSHLL